MQRRLDQVCFERVTFLGAKPRLVRGAIGIGFPLTRRVIDPDWVDRQSLIVQAKPQEVLVVGDALTGENLIGVFRRSPMREDQVLDRKSTRLNSSHTDISRM